jgi:hypothetical protein
LLAIRRETFLGLQEGQWAMGVDFYKKYRKKTSSNFINIKFACLIQKS